MCQWRNRRRCIRKAHGRVATQPDKGLVREVTRGHEAKSILRELSIACATWPVTFQARTRADDRWRNRLTPTSRFAAKVQAIHSVRRIRWHWQSTKTTMVQAGALP